MQTSTVLSSSSRHTRGTAALILLAIAGTALTSFTNQARANDGQVVLSTGIGAVAGALIGQSIGGRNATIVGGALGAAIGASAATQGHSHRSEPPRGYYQGDTYRQGYRDYQGYQDHRAYQGGYSAYPPIQVVRVVRPYARQVVYPAYYPPYNPVYYREDNRGQYDSDDRGGRGRGR